MEERETVYLKRGCEYSPNHPKADVSGLVTLWYAYNKNGVAVTWADTKAKCISEARQWGYKVSSIPWDDRR